MTYVDGFVVPVPKKKLAAYHSMAKKAGKVMKDKRLAAMMNPKTLPFDGKRMIFGGFKPFLEL